MATRLSRDGQELIRGLAATLIPAEAIKRDRRVDMAVTNDGKPVLTGRTFLPVLSPDGSTWRITVSNTGVITATKE